MTTPAGSEKGSGLLEGLKEASSSNNRQEGPEEKGLNMEYLKVIEFNSADEVRQMAKAMLKSGQALGPDLSFNDPEPVESLSEECSGPQTDVPMKLATSAHGVTEEDLPKSKQSKLLARKVFSRQSNSKKKKKSKFVSICKRTVNVSVSRYTGELTFMTNFGREQRRRRK